MNHSRLWRACDIRRNRPMSGTPDADNVVSISSGTTRSMPAAPVMLARHTATKSTNRYDGTATIRLPPVVFCAGMGGCGVALITGLVNRGLASVTREQVETG
jgi:hypothetical protein